MPRIELVGVSKRYDSGEGLEPTDLVIESGEVTTLLGPSGSGKSTLLRLIAGLEQPDAGAVFFDGARMNGVDPHSRGLGLVVTEGALYNNRTAGGNISFPLEMERVEPSVRRRRVTETARRFRLFRLLHRPAGELSAGQRQMVATSRAIVRENRLVLFDEALAGVDPHLKASVKAKLHQLHDSGNTLVFATNHQEEGMALATRLVVLRKGEVQQVGRPAELYREPVNVFVAQFLGEPGMNIVPALRLDGERVRVGDDELWLPQVPETRDGRILLGVRPEHVDVAAPDAPYRRCFHARVTFVENIGHERLVHVAFGAPDTGSLDFVFRSRAHGLVPGDRVELQLTSATFFDPESGDRLVGAAVS